LSEVLAEQVERLEAEFREAAELEAAFRFDEAIVLLAQICKNDHPRLTEYVQRARKILARLTAQRQEQRTAMEAARTRAKQCLAAGDYDGAAQAVDTVPLPLQDEEMRRLREQIAQRRREIDVLTEELQSAVNRKRLLELPPLIERLLALKPDHAYARSVAGEVQKRFIAAAQKMLAEHRYGQALDLLNRISGWADAPEFPPLRRQAAELAWLDWDLRHAPFVDDTLKVVAERLRRSAPDNVQVGRLCQELQRRVRLAEGKPQLQPLPWAHPPKQTPLGAPVDWLTGFRRITYAESLDRSHLSQYPGRFAVACGLALAGLKQAALPINLLSGQQKGILHRAKNLMRLQTTRSAWGIDLGAGSLKAVRLAWDGAKRQAVLKSVVLIEHTKVLSHTANEAEEKKLVLETLRAFLKGHQIKNDLVCVSLPGLKVLSRQIELPPVDPSKAPNLVQFEATHHFPIPLEQLAWDYQLVDAFPSPHSPSKTPDEKPCQALLMAARRITTQQIVDTFQQLNLHLDLLQPDFIALHNLLAYDHLSPAGDSPPDKAHTVVAAVDVGCDVTNIIVSSLHSAPWFRSCGVSGHSFTRALVKEYKLSFNQAEQLKRAPESAESLSDLYQVMSPVFDELVAEVKRILADYSDSHPDRSVQHIFGLGGGFALHGLLRYFRFGQ